MKTKIIYFIFCIIFSTKLLSDVNYFETGKKLFDKKNFSEAKLKFEQDIVFNPKNENSYLYLAKIFKIEEKDNLEEQNLNTVILLNPKNEEAIYELALLKIKKSNFSETEKLISTFGRVCKVLCKKKIDLETELKNSLKN
tara:strand:+ start:890 stop:1309 length:420 start_codon:yes stop_codon:yes gene_type:complete